MDFSLWEPHYREILDYFGFSRKEDEKAAALLATLTDCDDLPALYRLVRNRSVVVCGNASCLRKEIGRIPPGSVVFAADAAADVLTRTVSGLMRGLYGS